MRNMVDLYKRVIPLKVFLLLLITLYSNAVFANGLTATAEADTNKIRIGEQFHINLTANIPFGYKVIFPALADTFNHFEIVNRGAIDTLSDKSKKDLTLRQQLTLTSFDSGFHVIPPMPFLVQQGKKTDTLLTEASLMTVVTVPVDTTKDIKPLKSIMEVPFPWLDYLLYLLLFFAITGIIYVLYKKFYRKKVAVKPERVIPARPAHEIALEKLKQIEQEKLWQQGFIKKYFSEITDTLRQYIENRFGVFAMEQTTDEILRHFENDLIKQEEKEKLKYVLRLADMVKFAKAITIPTENETSMQYAYDFINMTRPVVKEDFEKKEKEVTT